MTERLWSGAGCADNPAFEFAKHSDTGVPLYRKIAAGEVALDDGGATFIIKRAAPAPERKEAHMPPIDVIIAKAMAPDPADTPREADRKRLMKAQLDSGKLSAEMLGAELALESVAKTLRDKHPTMSPEQAFVKAMDLHPDLANIAVNG